MSIANVSESPKAACVLPDTTEHKSKQQSSLGLLTVLSSALRLSKKIRYIETPSFQFRDIPDVGMDCFMVSAGKFLGTSGLGPCFAICMIGRTRLESPVLGLCHKSSAAHVRIVLQMLRDKMVAQEQAVPDTIKTYIIGGEGPSEEDPEGTLEEEKEIILMGKKEHIEEVLFNKTRPESDEALSVVLTPESVYVSKEDLFHVTGGGDGISL